MVDRWLNSLAAILGLGVLGLGLPFGLAEAAMGRLIYQDGIFSHGAPDYNEAIVKALVVSVFGAVFYALPLRYGRKFMKLHTFPGVFLLSFLIQVAVLAAFAALVTVRPTWMDGIGYLLLALILGGAASSLLINKGWIDRPNVESR
jgi:hypothetical protein